MVWSHDEIADLVAEGLARREGALHLEQAVRGLDALSEVGFHPLVADIIRAGGFGVWREWPFPGEAERRLKRPERERCDLVLTASGSRPVRDPVARLLELDKAAGTLFAEAAPPPPPPGVEPEEAYWLELKVVGQFTYVDGVPSANRSYGSDLVRSLWADLKKLSREARIRFGGAMMILFTDGRATAEHDLSLALHRCLDKGVEMRTPIVRHIEIGERIGNRACAVVLVPKG